LICRITSRNSFWGDILGIFVEPALGSGKVDRILFAGTVGALDPSLPNYSLVRAGKIITASGLTKEHPELDKSGAGKKSRRRGSSPRGKKWEINPDSSIPW